MSTVYPPVYVWDDPTNNTNCANGATVTFTKVGFSTPDAQVTAVCADDPHASPRLNTHAYIGVATLGAKSDTKQVDLSDGNEDPINFHLH